MREVLVRAAGPDDLPQLTEIYNHYVRSSVATFDLEPFALEQRREWLGHYGDKGRHRLLVALEGSAVLGYASSSRWRPKRAYDTTVEATVYCQPGAVGRRIGTLLYQRLFEALALEDVWRVVAGIVPPNEPSVRLHEGFGFKEVGRFTQVGRKFGRYWDVVWFEKAMRP